MVLAGEVRQLVGEVREVLLEFALAVVFPKRW